MYGYRYNFWGNYYHYSPVYRLETGIHNTIYDVVDLNSQTNLEATVITVA